MLKKYCFAILFIFSSIALFASEPFFVYFETANSSPNSIEVDVNIKDFDNVSAAQMYLSWDSTVYFFDTIFNINPDLNNFLFNSKGIYLEKNIMAVTWYNLLPNNFTDSTTLFTIRLTTNGEPCDSTSLNIADLGQFRQSLAVYEIDNVSYEAKIRYEQSIFSIPGNNCDITSSSYISKPSSESVFSVFPNPASNEFNINIVGEYLGKYHLEIFNIFGEKLFKKTIHKKSYNTTTNVVFQKIKNQGLLIIKLTDRYKRPTILKVNVLN